MDDRAALPVLEQLFPAGVACVISRTPPADFVLLPAEQEAARRMSPRRYAEFLHGRACARRALSNLGVPGAAVPTGTHREPLWPAGIVGSISHAQGFAAVAVGWQREFAGLGLDLELAEPLELALVERICRPEEIDRLGADPPPDRLAKLIFSIKESVYKCVWPLAREFLDFHDVEVRLDREAGTFDIVSHARALPAALAGRIVGRFQQSETLVAAGAVIRQA